MPVAFEAGASCAKSDENVHTDFGCTAKSVRIRNGLEKDHALDARCIGGDPASALLMQSICKRLLGGATSSCTSRQPAKAEIES
jgi:hypothetical protein